jgi:hypothetical protein
VDPGAPSGSAASPRFAASPQDLAHADGNRVQLIPLQPDEEKLSYRLLHTQPNLSRYREGYGVARAAKDDFAARFYLKLLPPAEQKFPQAQAAAEEEIAAGRTQDALVHLVTLSAAQPGSWRPRLPP